MNLALAALALFLPACPQDPKPDSDALAALEEKLAKVKTLSVKVTVNATMGETRKSVSVFLYVAEGNRLNCTMEAEKDKTIHTVSNGGTMRVNRGGDDHDFKTPDTFCRNAVAALVRAGGIGLDPVVGGNAGDRQPFTAKDVREGERTKLAEREVRVVAYVLVSKTDKNDANVTLWLDAKSGLPVKREIAPNDGSKLRITETYDEFVLDAKLDDKLFKVLPPK